jgi:two-component system LytT family response regulator
MIRTLIVDDEENNRLRLARLISEHFPIIDVVGEADGVETGVQSIEKLRPELVLLDIKMGDGDAFDLLQKIDDIFFKIIFITAYEEYALRAFKYSALDYLLKPVTTEQLQSAFERVEKQLLADLNLQLSILQKNLDSPKQKILVLKTSDKIYLVNIDEIVRCESDANYTRFFTSDGYKYLVSSSMIEYEGLLETHGFFRIHRSHIVNISFIKSLDRHNGYVILRDETSLPLSRRKKQELLDLLDNL